MHEKHKLRICEECPSAALPCLLHCSALLHFCTIASQRRERHDCPTHRIPHHTYVGPLNCIRSVLPP